MCLFDMKLCFLVMYCLTRETKRQLLARVRSHSCEPWHNLQPQRLTCSSDGLLLGFGLSNPMLTIKRPTPTTVLYTVSTRPPIKTVIARVQAIFLTLIRVLLGTLVLLVLWEQAHNFSPLLARYQSPFRDTPPGQLAFFLSERFEWHYVLPLCAGVAWAITRRGYTEESLLVIRGLGVQTSTSSPSYLSSASTRFIPTNMIQDIFIHEAFKGFEVKFYLAIVVEDEEDVVVVFPVRFISCNLGTYLTLTNAEHFAQKTALGRDLARSSSLLVRAEELNSRKRMCQQNPR